MKHLISGRFTMIVGQACRTFVTSIVPRIRAHRRIPWLIFITIFAAVALFHTLAAVAQGDENPLFDGKTFHGWTTLDGKPVKQGWEIVDGIIHLTSSRKRGGDIVTE